MRIETMLSIAAVTGVTLIAGVAVAAAEPRAAEPAPTMANAARCVALAEVEGLGGAQYDTDGLSREIDQALRSRSGSLGVRSVLNNARREADEARNAQTAQETNAWRQARDNACAPFQG